MDIWHDEKPDLPIWTPAHNVQRSVLRGATRGALILLGAWGAWTVIDRLPAAAPVKSTIEEAQASKPLDIEKPAETVDPAETAEPVAAEPPAKPAGVMRDVTKEW